MSERVGDNTEKNGLHDAEICLEDRSGSRIEAVIINEIQLILAEKRTSLSALRTGIAVFVLPLSVLSVLVGTSRFFSISQAWPYLLPLLGLCLGLAVLGIYLVTRAILRIHHHDELILKLKRKHEKLAEFID